MYIHLDLLTRFSCAQCGLCCRRDWQVTVDEVAYHRNKAWFTKEGNETEFRQAFQPLTQNAAPGEFAAITKQPEGGCWFLDDANLCRLHRQLGHEHLDKVCQTYPRYPMSTSRGIETTLSFSCPAVLELACCAGTLDFVRCDSPPYPLQHTDFTVSVFPEQQPASSLLKRYFEMEHHFIDILQCHPVSLRERLELIGKTIERFESLDNPSSSDFNRIIYENYAYLDEISARGTEYPIQICISAHFLTNLVFKKVFYQLGLRQGHSLLENLRAAIECACSEAAPGHELSAVLQAVSSLEYEYSHDRKTLLSRYRNSKP